MLHILGQEFEFSSRRTTDVSQDECLDFSTIREEWWLPTMYFDNSQVRWCGKGIANRDDQFCLWISNLLPPFVYLNLFIALEFKLWYVLHFLLFLFGTLHMAEGKVHMFLGSNSYSIIILQFQQRRLLLHTDHTDDLFSREKIEAQSSSGVDLQNSTYPIALHEFTSSDLVCEVYQIPLRRQKAKSGLHLDGIAERISA